MTFRFSRQGLAGRERVLERAFEILPGATSWTILVGTLLLSFWKPIHAAVLIIAFDLYWLLRLFYMTLFLVASYLRLSVEQRTDWMAWIRAVDPSAPGWGGAPPKPPSPDLRRRLSHWLHRRDIASVRRRGFAIPALKDIRHVVIIPIAREGRDVIEPGIQSLARQTFPARQILVALALEERSGANVKEDARAAQARYREAFLDFLVIPHPDGLPGEARVKGANATCAARAAAACLERSGVALEHVVASCFDADTVVSPDYFACLTYRFMTCPARARASFQPIPVYHNNIWEVPAFARILDIGSSFFQLVEAANPEKLVTFSSHSMSFLALADVGYWPVDMVSDDSGIFWKAFLHYEGDYRVVPLPVTLSMDVVAAESWWKTIRSVYKQKRRWAWGVEHFPIVMRGFLRSRRLTLLTKVRHGFKLFEGHVAWATWAFLLTIIGWFPALLAGREFPNAIIYYSAPRITATIFHLSSLALLTTILLSFCLLPKRPGGFPLVKRVWLACEWLLVPLVSVFLAALPALDAQTRLLLGRYMEFWVTEKTRVVAGHGS